MIYRLIRAIFALSLRGFFRSVEVQGIDDVPAKGPVLLVSNHVNGFVDPLLALTALRRPVTLTAKATLRSNPLLAPIIRGLGVVLFHRRQDREEEGGGGEGNARAIARCVSILRGGGAVYVFPEGVSHSDPAMRTFRTGAARIAAEYLHATGASALTIVPIGLHFGDKARWRSDAVALVGNPYRITAEEAADPRALTREMRRRIGALTANFDSAEERELILRAGHLFDYHPAGPEPIDRVEPMDARVIVDRVHRLQRGARALRARRPERFDDLAREGRVLGRKLERLGVRPEEVSISMSPARAALFVTRELEVLLVGAPLAAWGWIANVIPLSVTRRLVAAMSRDPDHPASNAVFLSPPIFLLWWVVAVALTAVLASPAWALALAASLPLTLAVNLLYRDRGGGAIRRARTFLLWLVRPEYRERLAAELDGWQKKLLALEGELGLEPEFAVEPESTRGREVIPEQEMPLDPMKGADD